MNSNHPLHFNGRNGVESPEHWNSVLDRCIVLSGGQWPDFAGALRIGTVVFDIVLLHWLYDEGEEQTTSGTMFPFDFSVPIPARCVVALSLCLCLCLSLSVSLSLSLSVSLSLSRNHEGQHYVASPVLTFLCVWLRCADETGVQT